VGLQTDTIQVTGVRCERCVMRLGSSLEGLDGLEAANANLMGQVTLAWDDERLGRGDIVEALTRAGFRPAPASE
jgi:copper chaperone CopZ